jgi:hypothetical protein
MLSVPFIYSKGFWQMGTDAQGRTFLSFDVAVAEEGEVVATLSINKYAYKEGVDVTLEMDPDVSMASLIAFFAEIAESLTRVSKGDVLPEFVDWGGVLWEAGDQGELPF